MGRAARSLAFFVPLQCGSPSSSRRRSATVPRGAELPSLWRRLRGLSDIRAPPRPSAVDTEKQTASVSCSLNLRDMLTLGTCAFKEKQLRHQSPPG